MAKSRVEFFGGYGDTPAYYYVNGKDRYATVTLEVTDKGPVWMEKINGRVYPVVDTTISKEALEEIAGALLEADLQVRKMIEACTVMMERIEEEEKRHE